MELGEAISLLKALADGIDPVTGEAFADDSPYQHPRIIRALFTMIHATEHAQNTQQEPPRQSPQQAGRPWSGQEDQRLRDAFAAGSAVRDMAESHGRTAGAIRSRLKRLGLIEDRQDTV